MAGIKVLSTPNDLKDTRSLVLLHLFAPWSPQCDQMAAVMRELTKEPDFKGVTFAKLEAEKAPEFCQSHQVVAVPTFLFLKDGKLADRVDGAHAPQLNRKLRQLSQLPEQQEAVPQDPAVAKKALEERLKHLVSQAPVMLFMKGSPDEPKCGFSKKMVALLKEEGATIGHFDILTDNSVRQGLKEFSNWPTFPQLYVKGELVGGLDVLQEMKDEGELASLLPKAQPLEERLKELIGRAKVMLFMKGDKDTPRCGFSKTVTQMLNETGVSYDTFDILQDPEVRHGLKTFSNWPTYPQLYVDSTLVGGLDVLKELQEEDELMSTLQGSS